MTGLKKKKKAAAAACDGEKKQEKRKQDIEEEEQIRGIYEKACLELNCDPVIPLPFIITDNGQELIIDNNGLSPLIPPTSQGYAISVALIGYDKLRRIIIRDSGLTDTAVGKILNMIKLESRQTGNCDGSGQPDEVLEAD
ncbi:hypothetical protein FOL47_002681 [Perkinsus chesapeaki]|uniref:Uncharacterized protein n=1 Tax=Perkinsus chesapeaki TaxID=330153 RepID=A0A7J6MC99_PERCH|nr:hypothetical protein FOL47_002681 [Perkinsus chesapeaki]